MGRKAEPLIATVVVQGLARHVTATEMGELGAFTGAYQVAAAKVLKTTATDLSVSKSAVVAGEA